MENITLRQWIENFNEGKYNTKDLDTQCEAGWFDWFCKDTALAYRLKKMGHIIKNFDNDYLLDNYYVWFKNNCPASDDPLYDDFRLEPINPKLRKTHYFVITCDDRRYDDTYNVFTARNDYELEFTANTKEELLEAVNTLMKDLEVK